MPWPDINPQFECYGGKARYMLAKRSASNGVTHVGMAICERCVLMAVVDSKPMETGQIAFLNASAMQKSLDATGRVSLYGIYFDTDKDTIKPEPKPTLDEINKLIQANPQLRLQVVGHTDSTGGDAHNKDLLNRRAASVIQALTQIGVDAKRLTSRGAGASEPVAPQRQRGRTRQKPPRGTGADITMAIPHSYPLAVRGAGLGTAISLMLRSLPYALMRFGVLLIYSLATIVWLAAMAGGAAWLGAHVASAFSLVWVIGCLAVGGGVWTLLLRYALHLIECGHVAVLTELITHGKVNNGVESMFAYGKRIVIARFGEANALFALNLLVRGVVNAVNGAVKGLGSFLSIPGLETVIRLFTAVLRAATRYMDKAIFSYNLTQSDVNPWSGARDGLVYYAQNAKPILKQAVWIVVLDYRLSAALWLALLAPAAAITVLLPQTVRELGGIVSVVIAILFALAARGAFVKPLFLIMIVTRFLNLAGEQDINRQWVERLDQVSGKFRDLGQRAAQTFTPAPTPAPAP